MDLGSGLAAAGQAISIAKTLRHLEKNYDEAKLRAELLDLMDHLNSVREALQDAREEAREKDAEIARLKATAARRAETIEVEGFRYETRDGKATGLPFCPRCDEVDNRLIRVQFSAAGRGSLCPQCKSAFRVMG